MSGTSTVTSSMTRLEQLSRQPSANSSSLMCRVLGLSTVPSTSLTRHLPQEPLPEQGASMATLARRASSRRFSPALHSMTTGLPPSIWKVTFMDHRPFGMCFYYFSRHGAGISKAFETANASPHKFHAQKWRGVCPLSGVVPCTANKNLYDLRNNGRRNHLDKNNRYQFTYIISQPPKIFNMCSVRRLE